MTDSETRPGESAGVATIGGHSIVYALSSLFGQLGTLFTFPLYTRALGRDEYGVLALLLSASGVVRTLVIAGVNTSLMHERVSAKDRDAARVTTAACLWVVFAAIAVGVLMLASAPWIERVFDFELRRELVVAITAFVAFDSLYEMILATARADSRAGSYAYSNVIRVAMTLMCAATLLLVFRAGAVGAVYAMAMGSAAAAVWLARALPFDPELKGALGRVPGLLRSGLPLVPANLASWISNLSDRYLLLILGGTASTVGLYSAGYRLGSLITTLFVGPFHTAFLPLMLKSRGAEQDTGTYRDASRVFLVVGSLAVLILQAVSVPTVLLLAGQQFAGAERVVGPVAFGCLLAGAAMLMTPSALTAGRPHTLSLAFGIGAAVNVGMNVILIPEMGMVGAAIATLVGYAVVLVAMLSLTAPDDRPPEVGRTLTRLLPIMTVVTVPSTIAFGSPGGQAVVSVSCAAAGVVALAVSGVLTREDISLLVRVAGSAITRAGNRIVPRDGRLGPRIRLAVRTAISTPRAVRTLGGAWLRVFTRRAETIGGACADPPYLKFLRSSPDDFRRATSGACQIMDGEVMTFGLRWRFRDGSDWHLDPFSGRRWSLLPAGLIDVNWVVADSDIQCVWETSRLEHLWRVALEYARTGDESCAAWVVFKLRSWNRWNPLGIGVNWTVTMEIALRAIALVEIRAALCDSPHWTAAVDKRTCAMAADHAQWALSHLEHRGEGTQNHYLASLVGVLSVASHLPEWEWLRKQVDWVCPALWAAVDDQVMPDGVDFENSLGYHLLVCELVGHAVMDCRAMGIEPPREVLEALSAMIGFARAMEFADGTPVAFGDDDDDFIVPSAAEYFSGVRPMLSARLAYACKAAGLSSHAGRIEPPVEFPDAGIYILGDSILRAIVNVMPTGVRGTGPHRHNDALSFCLEAKGHPVVVDPGTYRYQSSGDDRDRYRSVAAHSTVQLDGLEQNAFVGPFALSRDRIAMAERDYRIRDGLQSVSACHSGFLEGSGVVHRRRWTFESKDSSLLVEDSFESSPDDRRTHRFVARLHFPPGMEARLSCSGADITISAGPCIARATVTGGVGVTGRIVDTNHSPYYRHEVSASALEISWEGAASTSLATRFGVMGKED